MASVTRIAEVEEICAARIANRVAEEIKLRDIVEQTRTQFYLGMSIRSAILRVTIGVAALFLLFEYYPYDNPLLALLAVVAAVEILRIDGRVDALNRLFLINAERQSELSGNKQGEQDVEPDA